VNAALPRIRPTSPTFAGRLAAPRTETVVAAGWALLSVAAVWFAWHFRGPVPSGDEWWDVPVADGEFPLTLGYLWGATNDHRCPLSRLLYYAIHWATGFEVRAIAVANVLLLSGAAAALMLTLRARRGWSSPVDLAAPFALLNVGMWEPFLWNAQFHLALGTTLALVVLVVTTGCDSPPSRRTLGVVAGLGVLLVGCGGAGLPYVPAVAGWLGWAGFFSWRAGRRGVAALAVVLAAGLAGLVAAYFVPDGSVPPNPSRGLAPSRILQVALQFVAVGFGPVGFRWLPGDPAAYPILGAITSVAITAVAAAGLWNHKRIGVAPVAGLLCVLAGFAAIALGLAASRGGDSPAPGYGPRYTVLAVVGVCWLSFAAATLGGRWGRIVGWAVAAFAAAVWTPSFVAARVGALDQKRWLNEMAADVRAGMPVDFVADKYSATAGGFTEYFADRMLGLRAAGVKPFDRLKSPRTFAEVPVNAAATTAANGWTECDLGGARPVKGLRVRYSFRDTRTVSRVMVECGAARWHSFRAGADNTALIWVDGEADLVRFYPPPGSALEVRGVTILTDPTPN
jgi:hypothetical protein